ncbi:hypothetical protein [Oculatella sp. LEGE 06141]|uniref:hypothetical protein n=1 Tax=Oculatella sp. LEGE 06141 TaxID=1828648 RepID=UPI001D15BE6E|nr:hypothetical protein [Oculatella sp. LEGE 06141]
MTRIKNNFWFLGVLLLAFGIVDRSSAAVADNYFSTSDFLQLSLVALLFGAWLYLKPGLSFASFVTPSEETNAFHSASNQDAAYIQTAQKRMQELRDQHLISQKYTLAFPYVCQIYHLLNLKHLEKVHSFSLSNLRVIKVSHFEPTKIGGTLKFQTMLDSPFNALRIWRQPIVEVDLTLHTPYMVELSIPVYNDKRITVIFNVLPLSRDEHQLFIDIYSNLKYPRPLMQMLLHTASCLTLFEDLPYLHKLSERSIHRLVSLNRISDHETMLLFRRFVDLYQSTAESAYPVSATV